MKSPYVGGLVPNEVSTVQFIVINKEIRQKKTGEPYLSLQLADRTGEIEAKMWDNVEEVMHTFERDDFVKVKGLMQIYQKRAQFTVHRLRRMEDSEVDFSDYFPCSERSLDEMVRELHGIIAAIENVHLRSLLEAIFRDAALAQKFQTAPAAKSIHHACRGGLLEHVLSLCTLAKLVSGHYKNVDLDLVLTGALLHDIGKIEELSYLRSFGYSSEGQLLGHIVIGLRILGEKIRAVPEFPPRLRTLVEHLIISHHGELQFGSPKLPSFPEALLLHHLDNMDSKMEAMRNTLHKSALTEAEFTGWVPALERSLLRKEQFLQGPNMQAPIAPVPVVPVPEVQTPAAVIAVAEEQPVQLPIAIQEATPPTPPPAAIPTVSYKQPESPHGAPGLPGGGPVPSALPPRDRVDRRPAAPTLFGEKLQAVLGPRK